MTSVLSSASSRPYLSHHTLTHSLLTLTTFINTFLSGQSLTHCCQGNHLSPYMVIVLLLMSLDVKETGQMIYKSLLPWLPDMIQNIQELLLKGSFDGVTITNLTYLTHLTSLLSSLYTFTTHYGFTWSAGISPAHVANTAVCTLHSLLTTDNHQSSVCSLLYTSPDMYIYVYHNKAICELKPSLLGAISALGWVCEKDFDLSPMTLSSLSSLPITLSLAIPSSRSVSY